jgi:hypothetical protein
VTRGRVSFSLALLAAASGCVSAAEYRAFVAASRGFFDSVAPVFSDATLHDPGLSDTSKRNRLGEVTAYERALVSAEERVK